MIALKVLVVAAAVGACLVGLRLWRRPPRISHVELSSLGASGAAIVQFGTTHCAPCKQARPVLERTARDAGVVVVDEIRRELAERVPLVDEIVVMDSMSTDGTVEAARTAGAVVYQDRDILPQLEPLGGKGDALWKSLFVLSGDLIVFVDADIRN